MRMRVNLRQYHLISSSLREILVEGRRNTFLESTSHGRGLAPSTTPTVTPELVRYLPLAQRCEVWGWRRLVGWIVVLLENCQLEAATPGPRIAVFALRRQRGSGSSLLAEAGPGGPVAASARPPTSEGVELHDSWKVQNGAALQGRSV